MYRNIKQIYIGNVLESFYKSYSRNKMPRNEAAFWRKYDALENNRSLLYGNDDKILITPEKIDADHLNYICELAGWRNVHNLVPKKMSDCISSDILSDQSFFENLKQIIGNNSDIEIIQYRHTPEFYNLKNKLVSIFADLEFPELVSENDKFIEEYFHCKRGFRHLWEQVKDPKWEIQIPEGFITGDKKEAIEAAWWFRNKGRNFAIKYNKGVQGIGIFLNKATDFPNNYLDFVNVWEKLLVDGIWDEPSIVVEEMIMVNHKILGGSPSIEVRIDKPGKVRCEYGCAQVLDFDGKTFLGVTMNPEVDSNYHMKEAFKAGEVYGQRLSELGYRGVFDIDLVVSTENKLYAVEANLRRNGGTHAHDLCQRLLGNDYSKQHWVHLQDIDLKNTNKNMFQKMITENAYDAKSKTGIIPVNPDMMVVNKAPILVIAPDEEILNQLLGRVNKLNLQ